MFRIFRRRRSLSLLEAIGSLLSAQQLERAALRCADWRELIDVAASESSKYSIRQYASKVAGLIGVAFQERVEPADLSLLEAGIGIKDLMRLAMIPLTSEGKIEALICVDPARLKNLPSAYSALPRRLALWGSIRVALEESERLHRRRSARNAQNGATVSSLHEAARSILAMLVNEVESYGQSSVTIEFGLSAINYQFLTRDRQVAQGSVSQKIRTPLLALLERAANEGHSVDVKLADSIRELEVQKLEGSAKRVLITWQLGKALTESEAEISSARFAPAALEAASVEIDPKTAPPPNAPALTVVQNKSEATTKQSDKPGERHSEIQSQSKTSARAVVLVIDDNVTFLTVLGRFFGNSGIEVRSFSDPTKALEALAGGLLTPDAIVCDVHMPGKSGVDFIREARAIRSCRTIPAIMLTSDDDVETELKALAQGADAFILKNEDPRVLMAYVERLLGRRAAA